MKTSNFVWIAAGIALLLLTGVAAMVGLPMIDLHRIGHGGGSAVVPLLLLAGLVDGVNPCAFSTLLVFVGALLAYLNAKLQGENDLSKVRRTVLGVGFSYAAGIFGVYLLAGFGLFGAARFIPTAAMPWVLRGSGLVVIVMGLIMIQEYFNPESPIRLGIPASLHRRVHRYAHATNIGTAFAAGAAIGLCSVPCSGAVYLGVVSLLTMFGPILGIVYLLLYNVAFILPVLILLFTVTSRPALLSFTHWYLNFRQTTKLWLGVFVILLGFLVIWLA